MILIMCRWLFIKRRSVSWWYGAGRSLHVMVHDYLSYFNIVFLGQASGVVLDVPDLYAVEGIPVCGL